MSEKRRYVYGPVYSRRLGRSLGLDLVPFKTCTYDCIYCQLGRTTNKTVERKEYAPLEAILDELEGALGGGGPAPDYITLAGSGEPTLNSRIGELIDRIKSRTDIPLAVLTNGSLLWLDDLQRALAPADLVIPSLDAGDALLFQEVNRPHPEVDFEKMLEGLAEFRRRFTRLIWLEVFLLADINDLAGQVEKLVKATDRVRPDLVQLNTVSRPPCEDFARPVSRSRLDEAAGMFHQPALVIGETSLTDSGKDYSKTATDDDILALLARRPCTVGGVAAGLALHINEASKRLHKLRNDGQVSTSRKNGETFYHAVSR
ncbi:MAG: radical SAM protein [Pseudomonadota bacterium]